MRRLEGVDPLGPLQRQRDVVEALEQHVACERVEREGDREPVRVPDLERLEVDGQLVAAARAPP